jgi:hypothetical protein
MHLNLWTSDNPDATCPCLTINMTDNDTSYFYYWMRKTNYVKNTEYTIGILYFPRKHHFPHRNGISSGY